MKRCIINFRIGYVLILFLIITTHISPAIDQARAFGKTHFIVGNQVPKTKVKNQELAAHTLLTPDGVIKHAFFAPDQNVRDVFIDLIKHEQESIKIAIYYFTDSEIAKELLVAFDKGVKVEIVTDQSCADSKYNKVCLLEEHAVPVYVFNGKKIKNGPYPPLMHNKFALFKKNIAAKSILWTGSFNLTRTATLHNQENVIVLDDPVLFQQFDQQFSIVKSRCKPYKTSLVVAQRAQNKPLKRAKRLRMEYLSDLPALLV